MIHGYARNDDDDESGPDQAATEQTAGTRVACPGEDESLLGCNSVCEK